MKKAILQHQHTTQRVISPIDSISTALSVWVLTFFCALFSTPSYATLSMSLSCVPGSITIQYNFSGGSCSFDETITLGSQLDISTFQYTGGQVHSSGSVTVSPSSTKTIPNPNGYSVRVQGSNSNCGLVNGGYCSGNPISAPTPTPVPDTTPPAVSITNAPTITSTNQNNYTVSGTCTNGDGNVSVTINSATPSNRSVNCSSGNWSANFDMSSIGSGGNGGPGGTVTISASQTDAASNTGSDSSNVTQTLPTPTPTPLPSSFTCDTDSIDFTGAVTAFGSSNGGDTTNGTVEVLDNGCTLKLTGNRWQKFINQYNITANSVIEFEYMSDSASEGEIHGMAFDADDAPSSERGYQFHGSQNWDGGSGASNNSYAYTAGTGNYQSFSIPVGQHYPGSNLNWVFVNDNDISSPNNTAYFRNVKFYENGTPSATPAPTPIACPALPAGNTIANLTGDATWLSSNEVQLTSHANDLTGHFTSFTQIDLTQDWRFDFDVYLGSHDGGDGIGFVLHNDPRGNLATGNNGSALGITGLSRAIGVEFDTYSWSLDTLANDHTAFVIPHSLSGGEHYQTSPIVIGGEIDQGELEDSYYYNVIVEWDVSAQAFSYTFNGGTPQTINRDITQDLQGTLAYWGFTASTGTAYNEHRVRINNFCGNMIAPAQTSFTTHTIPGIIQAEDYDNGGQGVAYIDNDTGNNGGVYRSDDVDIEASGDSGGGFNIGWVGHGERLNYTISTVQAGTYNIGLRVANPNDTNRSLTLSLGGTNLGTFTIPTTGGYQSYQTVYLNNINLPAGTNQLLTADITSGSFNINWLEFSLTAALPPSTPGLVGFEIEPLELGNNCSYQPIRIRACQDNLSPCTPLANYTGTVDLQASTNLGQWGASYYRTNQWWSENLGTLSNPSNISGGAQYQFVAADQGETILGYFGDHSSSNRSAYLTVTEQGGSSPLTARSRDIWYADRRMIRINPYAIHNNYVWRGTSLAQVTGRPTALNIEVNRQEGSGIPNCIVMDNAYGRPNATGNVPVKVWLSRTEDDLGHALPTLNGNVLPTSEPSSTNYVLSVSEGYALLILDAVPDIVKFNLHIKDETQAFGYGIFQGSTGFPVHITPFGFDVNVDTDPNAADAFATDLTSGSIFKATGDNFTTTVRAVSWQAADDANNDGVPDDGADLSDNAIVSSFEANRLVTESVNLSHNVVLGPSGTLNGGLNLSDFNNGQATTQLNYSAESIIDLTVNYQKDHQTLGTSKTLATYYSENVNGELDNLGRFGAPLSTPTPSSLSCAATENLSLQLADAWDAVNGMIGVGFSGTQTQRFTSPNGYPFDVTVSTSATPDPVENLDGSVGPDLEGTTYTVSFTETLTGQPLNIQGFDFYVSDFEGNATQVEGLTSFSYVDENNAIIASAPAWSEWRDINGNAPGSGFLSVDSSNRLITSYASAIGKSANKYARLDLSNQHISQFSFSHAQIIGSGGSVAGFVPISTAQACFTTALPPQPAFTCDADAIDFTDAVQAFPDDQSGAVDILDNGCTLKLSGNRWQSLINTYDLTTDSVIEFEYMSEGAGEIQGLGFANDNTNNASSAQSYKLFGTQAWGNTTQSYTQTPGQYQSFSIPVGQLVTGNNLHWVFANDNDADPSINGSNSYFRNVKFHPFGVEPDGSTTPGFYGFQIEVLEQFSECTANHVEIRACQDALWPCTVYEGFTGTVTLDVTQGRGYWTGYLSGLGTDYGIEGTAPTANGWADFQHPSATYEQAAFGSSGHSVRDGPSTYTFVAADRGRVRLGYQPQLDSRYPTQALTVSGSGKSAQTPELTPIDNSELSFGRYWNSIVGKPIDFNIRLWRSVYLWEGNAGKNCSPLDSWSAANRSTPTVTGSTPVKLWLTRGPEDNGLNPLPTLNGQVLPTSMPASDNVTLNYVDGEVDLVFDAVDNVVQFDVHIRDDSGTFAFNSHSRVVNAIHDGIYVGDTVVPVNVKPFDFDVHVRNDDNAANAFAADLATGTFFKNTHEDFPLEVRAVAWQAADDTDNDGIPDAGADLSDNDTVLGFGHEKVPETVTLTHSHVAGASGSLIGNTLVSGFNQGRASTNLQYDTLGIIDINANLTDANYLDTYGTIYKSTNIPWNSVNITGTLDNLGVFGGGIVYTPTPFASCPHTSLLIQSNADNTASLLYEVNIATGVATQATTHFGNVGMLNSLGYNTFDNYYYAWSEQEQAVVRIDSNYHVEVLPATLPAGLPNNTLNSGDISTSENTYFLYERGKGLYRLSLDASDANYLQAQRVDTGTALNIQVGDMAFNPSDNQLYTVDINGDLYRIDTTTGIATLISNMGIAFHSGGMYFDNNDQLYLSRNSTGDIYQINISAATPTAQLFSTGPIASYNDGARCSLAPLTPQSCPAIAGGSTTLSPVGSASWLSGNELQLTPDLQNQGGVASSINRIDLSQDWTFDFDVYLGSRDVGGADGLSFIMHNDPAGVSALSSISGLNGASGLNHDIGIEFDTFNNGSTAPHTDTVSNDHTRIFDTNFQAITSDYDLGDIEDGVYHNVVVEWDAATQTFSYHFNGTQIASVNRDITTDVGATSAYWGFAGATGGDRNDQRVRLNSFCGTMLDASGNPVTNTTNTPDSHTDTDGDGVPDVIDLDDDGDGIPDTSELVVRDFIVDTDNDGALDDSTDLLVIAGWYHNFPLDTTAQDAYATTINANTSGFAAMRAGSGGTWGSNNDASVSIPTALPPGANGDYVNLTIAARGYETVGAGVNSDLVDSYLAAGGGTGAGARSIDSGINQSTYANAVTDNDYIEYTFTTADSFAANSEVYFAAMTASDLNNNPTTVDLAVALSVDDFANSETLLEDHTLAAGTGTRVIDLTTPYQFSPATEYKVRIYFYNIASNQEIVFDNFQVAIKHYDQRHSDNDGIADHRDLDSDNDALNDVLEAGSLSDADGNGMADGVDANNDGIIDSFNATPQDSDSDGYADYRDLDSDDASQHVTGDGVGDDLLAAFTSFDSDNNGQLDYQSESDHDGIMNAVDGAVTLFGDASGSIGNPVSGADFDNDGIPDVLDRDDDNDGIPDTTELAVREHTVDSDSDGVIDDNTDVLVVAGWFHDFAADPQEQDAYATNLSASTLNFDTIRNGSGGTWGTNTAGHINITSAVPPGANGGYINLDSTARGMEAVGAGLVSNTQSDASTLNTGLNTLFDTEASGSVTGVRTLDNGFEQSTFANAVLSSDYLQYTFSTAHRFDLDSEVYLSAISATDFAQNAGNVDVAVVVSEDNFSTHAVLLEDQTFNGGSGNRVINLTPYQLAENTEYQVRVYFYNATNTNDELVFDDFQIAVQHFDTRHSDHDSLADHRDLDSDNDSINDVIEAGSLTDLDGNGLADGTDSNNDGIIDSFNSNPLDTDNDSYADYRDVDRDDATEHLRGDGVGDDIIATDFETYDIDNDGQIDVIYDLDQDGITSIADGDPNNFGDAFGLTGCISIETLSLSLADNWDEANGEIGVGFSGTQTRSFTSPNGYPYEVTVSTSGTPGAVQNLDGSVGPDLENQTYTVSFNETLASEALNMTGFEFYVSDFERNQQERLSAFSYVTSDGSLIASKPAWTGWQDNNGNTMGDSGSLLGVGGSLNLWANYNSAPGQDAGKYIYFDLSSQPLSQFSFTQLAFDGSTGSSVAGFDPTQPLLACFKTPLPELYGFNIRYDGNPNSCDPGEVVITACEDNASPCKPLTSYTGSVDLSSSLGLGTWSAVPGYTLNGTLSNAGADNGQASYQFAVADQGEIRLRFTYTGGGTLQLTATQAGSLTPKAQSTEPLNFLGRVLQLSAGTQPEVVGKPITVTASVLRDGGGGTCGIDTSYNGTASLKAWITRHLNDAGGTAPTITDANNLAVSLPDVAPSLGHNLDLNFVNGVTTFSINSTDIGQYQLNLRDDSFALVSDSFEGTSQRFTLRPFGLALGFGGDPNAANAIANTATDSAFAAAGADFITSVRAVAWQAGDDANNDGIPDASANLNDNATIGSFGQEKQREAVRITHTHAQPVAALGGVDGTLSGEDTITNFNFGIASPTLQYSEVGIIDLRAELVDQNYLDTGINLIGEISNVGRFIPAYLQITAESVNNACNSAGSPFTYIGQPFPVSYELSAYNVHGQLTQNYAGAFSKLNLNSANNSRFRFGLDNGALDLTARLKIASWAGNSFWNQGVGSGTGYLVLNRAAAEAPLNNIMVSIDPIDSDGVGLQSGAYNINTDGLGGADHQTIGSPVALRFGRARMDNGYGSELLSIEMRITVEHYVEVGNGQFDFIPHDNDNCTSVAMNHIGFESFEGNLTQGHISTQDSAAGSESESLSESLHDTTSYTQVTDPVGDEVGNEYPIDDSIPPTPTPLPEDENIYGSYTDPTGSTTQDPYTQDPYTQDPYANDPYRYGDYTQTDPTPTPTPHTTDGGSATASATGSSSTSSSTSGSGSACTIINGVQTCTDTHSPTPTPIP